MIDIDFFKHINDTHGHLTGDCALKKFSRTLTKTIRKTDIAGRYGSDEFLVIFSDTTAEQLIDRADKKLYKAKHLGRNRIIR